jgi:asparagine N-glycosylation enzyme membrane subunit Stt3
MKWRKISDHTGLIIALSLILSVLTSLFVISSRPFFQGTGDTSTYVSLSREIIENGLMIPQTNAIHYPGSVWVYPPVVPYIGALLMSITGSGGWTPYLVFGLLGSVIFSATAVPIYFLVRELYGKEIGLIASLIYPFFLPSLYILSWGGYPQLLGFLLLAMILYLLVRSERDNRNWLRYSVYSGLFLGLLALSHDLTFVVVYASVIILIVFRLITGIITRSGNKRTVLAPIVLLIISSAFGLYWYLPRLWWVKDSAIPTSSPVFLKYSVGIASSPGIMEIFHSDISGIQQPLGPISLLAPIFSLYAVLLIYLLVKMRNEIKGNRATDSIYLILVFTLILSLVELNDPVLFVRLFYFVILMGFVLSMKPLYYGFRLLIKKASSIHLHSGGISAGRLAGYALVFLIVINAVSGVPFNYISHTYYGSVSGSVGTDSQSIGLLNFIHSNISPDSGIAAPVPIAFYVMGFDGNPVIAYQPSNYLTQPVEWEENYAAYILIYHSSQNVSYTNSLIREYNISYILIPTHTQGIDSSYLMVYMTQFFILYKVS